MTGEALRTVDITLDASVCSCVAAPPNLSSVALGPMPESMSK